MSAGMPRLRYHYFKDGRSLKTIQHFQGSSAKELNTTPINLPKNLVGIILEILQVTAISILALSLFLLNKGFIYTAIVSIAIFYIFFAKYLVEFFKTQPQCQAPLITFGVVFLGILYYVFSVSH
jgi:hypothetical protein